MKKLILKETDIDNGQGGKFHYVDLIKFCLNRTPDRGFSYEEICKRSRIEKAIGDNREEIFLEDSDGKNLIQLAKDMTWSVRHRDIVQFVDDVKESMK